MESLLKTCSCCRQALSLSSFHKNKAARDGYNNCCKACKSKYSAGFKKEKTSLPDHQRFCPSCQQVKDKSQFFNCKTAHYCKKCIVHRNYLQYQKNIKKYSCLLCDALISKGKCCESCRPTFQKNKRKAYEFNRRNSDVQYRVKNNISRSIREMLKLRDSQKRNRAVANYLPYSLSELIVHLESNFETWMNWGNYGIYQAKIWKDDDIATWTWQIDHVIPHSSFDYHQMDEPAFAKCWSLENLRPLSAKSNIHKSNKLL